MIKQVKRSEDEISNKHCWENWEDLLLVYL